jgi:phage anti-repressor protein
MKTTDSLAPAENGQSGSVLMPEVVNGKVDARSVHDALEIATPFRDWIRRRIDEFGFVENEDFCRANLSGKPRSGAHNRVDYLLSIDMAKELAMVERSEIGRKMRRYFIECEKKLVQQAEIARKLDMENLSLPQWFDELGVDVVEQANLTTLLADRVDKAAKQLRYVSASFREADGFQRMPRAVLNLALGMFNRDASAPVNRHFFEMAPRLRGGEA